MAKNPKPAEACPLPDRSRDERLRRLLGRPRNIAIVGMSPNPERVSRSVGAYLRAKGFRVIPVHPRAKEVEGLRAYPSLDAIPREIPVDIVDVFVSAERVGSIAEEAARIGAKVIWFQPGAENHDAENRARQMGLEVISGRCIMADHSRLFG